MSKVVTDRSRSHTPRLGFVGSSANKGCDVGKIWCTHLDSQFLQTQRTVDFAYNRILRDLQRVVLQICHVTQPYIVTVSIIEQQDLFDEV